MPSVSRPSRLPPTAVLLLLLAVDPSAFAEEPEAEEPEGAAWVTAPAPPFTFWRFDAEWSREAKKVFFLGGRTAAALTDGSVWSFDPVDGTYADTLVDMPIPVSNYHIAALRDAAGEEVLMIFGGRPAVVPPTAVNVVQGYRPGDNTVFVLALDPYPIATSPGGVAVVDNKAWVFGGFDGSLATTAATYVFDPVAPDGLRWTAGPGLSLSRGYLSAAVIDGFIYAIGGDTWDGEALHAVQRVEKLDASNPVAWDDAGVADLPPVGTGPDFGCDENRSEGFDSGSVFGDFAGRLIMAGCGQWQPDAPPPPAELVDSHLYDATGNAWDTSFPDLNLYRRNHAGTVVPVAGFPATRPAFWIWGGRYDNDATLRTAPEFFELTTAALIFADDFDFGDLISWDDEEP